MSRKLTDPYQAPSFHDVFSSFPEEIQLTNKFTIIHTDATKELSYGKYTIFVSNDIIHRNRKCQKRTQEAPSYDFKYRYSDFSLCPDCWEDTDKLKYKDLFEPKWFSILFSMRNYVVRFKTPLEIPPKKIGAKNSIATFLANNSIFAPKELTSFNIIVSDIKNKVFIDDSLNIIHLDCTDNRPFGKYTFYRDISTHVKKHTPYNLHFPIAAYALTDIDRTMMCRECRRELSNYSDLISPRWLRHYSFLKKQQEQNNANTIPSTTKKVEESPKQPYMSKRIETEITCSECKETYTDDLWHTVNTSENPEAKDLLLSGELFASFCPHCKQKLKLNYSVLYYDEKSNFMCYYAPVKEEELKAIKMFNSMTNNAIKRIVYTQEQLTEKAFIFSNNLDDRVIECVKLDIDEAFTNQMPSLTYDYLLLSTCGEIFAFQPNGQKKYHYELPKDDFKKLEDLYTKFQPNTNNKYIIDRKWAKKFIKGVLDEIIPQILDNGEKSKKKETTTSKIKTTLKKWFTSVNILLPTIFLLSVFLFVSIVGNINQAKIASSLNSKIVSYEAEIDSLESRLSSAKNNRDYFLKKSSILQSKVDDYSEKLSFYEECVVIVPNDNKNTYHIYGCKYCDTSYFWAYNTKAAQDSGYSPCKYCCS